ncbi:amino acid transporter, putative [Talaromyces stipitatus ATCC 10500]|uniref:Amino acid transporter, putative n=1 Tax=Talaromyces stipitatus (strain ATCC 10500 / CBS 375.48 / QM 6759 / NRRL 1006) TaxID=441959 RepID=B8LX07_TALSN|nr:amino acid transporter, putative [Talaromyces stipitatus ATCC 10500]EED24640.1 amino acid transporter, putative [Talaromyces stipitatus ATCC 10500]
MEDLNNSKSPGKITTMGKDHVETADTFGVGQVILANCNTELNHKSDEAEFSAALIDAINHQRLRPSQIQFAAIAASRMVDPAVGVAVGWNYFFAQTSYFIFKATIINTLVEYWGYNQSPAVLISVTLVLFLALNIYRADLFGEAEFWLALGKIVMATGLILYTFIAMLGGNALHDPSSRLESFINAINVAGFCMDSPEYISIITGEARDPRRTMPRAFSSLMLRLMIFFIGGAFCVGVNVRTRVSIPYFLQFCRVLANLPRLTNGSDTYAGGSPYVISMQRLQIPGLPSIVNASLIVTIISGGNAYTFGASRSLHAMALDGQAPKFLRRLNNKGVPYMAVLVVLLLSCLAYLALGSGTVKVLNWILNNWVVMSFTWLRFNAAIRAQGIDRKSFLPSLSKYQPFAGYWAFFWAFLFLWVQGYAVFTKDHWKVSTFIFNYGIIALAGSIGIIWKIVKRTPFHKSTEVDLQSGLDFFETLTEHYQQERENVPSSLKERIVVKIF